MTRSRLDVESSKAAAKLGLVLWLLDEQMEGLDIDNMRIKEIRVRAPDAKRGEFLVIVKADMEGQRLVGFHSSHSASEAIAGAVQRIENRDLAFREDRPYPG